MSTESLEDILEFHWMMDMLQSVDVGIVVLNRQYEIQVWNGFMESHSGRLPSDVRSQSIFQLYPDIHKEWFEKKCRPVFELKTRTFITWEQRPYLFKFPNYRPITGAESFMYQNITLAPLVSATGKVEHISMMIYDMTDVASSHKELEALQVMRFEENERKAR